MARVEHPHRKLAVLLHADVVGSTGLVQIDEELAHTRITETFRALAATVGRFGGIVDEVRGDALVAEFARASDAVCAAAAFQAEQADRNDRSGDAVVAAVRIGISLGEVVVADGSVTGPGIVLAQRVEQLADSGGICITTAIREAVPDRLPFEYGDLGHQEAKGFEEPVHVYTARLRDGSSIPGPEASARPSSGSPWQRRFAVAALVLVVSMAIIAWWTQWGSDTEVVEAKAGLGGVAVRKPSIAVLPFDNMSGDREQAPESIRQALRLAQHALTLDANVPQVHFALAMAYAADGAVKQAVAAARRCVTLVPSYADRHGALGFIMPFDGDLAGALHAVDRGMRLNPHHSFNFLYARGRVLFLLGRFEEAVGQLEAVTLRNPDFDQARIWLIAEYVRLERLDDADWEYQELLLSRPRMSLQRVRSSNPFRDPEMLASLVDALALVGLRDE